MELVNTNDDNSSFDPTPRLKSSPVPITFISFNVNDDNCIYCGDEYTKTLFCSQQKYCKKCLSRYITGITDNDTYLDIYFYTRNLECNEHEISRTKEPQNIQECCRNCLEVVYFKQIPVFVTYNLFISNIKIYNYVIENENYCKLCGEPLYQLSLPSFKLCSSCYRISFGWINSTITEKQIPIIYLPWWHNVTHCKACKSHLIFTSDCQKYCAHCFIFYTGCRYCLTTNVIFGPANQSQCKKCKRTLFIVNISSSGNSDPDDFLFNIKFNILDNLNIAKFSNNVEKIDKCFEPIDILNSIYLSNVEQMIRWVPYSCFINVKKIAEGGFSIIYQATWLDEQNKPVILKRFKNSQDISKDFLIKLESIQSRCKIDIHIIKTYGITKDPDSEDYMLVMQYASKGDLHNYLQKDFTNITWNKQKLNILRQISEGLKIIHEKHFIHRDFHSGNILLDDNDFYYYQWKIGDLGLSQPANNASSNDEIYGVIPYIAPEIFKGSAFSKESDVYCMGMIMWELTTGCKPFANVEHDIHLVYKILDGKRPEITEDTPKCYADLMKRCWNPYPKKRPSLTEICIAFDKWAFKNKDIEEFNQAELKRIELINSKKLGPEFAEKPCSGTIYTSRPLSSLISECSSIISLDNEFDNEQEAIYESRRLSSLISKCSSVDSSFDNRQDYITKEFELDTESLPSSTLNPIIQNSPTSLHSNALWDDRNLNVLSTSLRKRNVEELNIETHDNNGKHIKTS